jgi:CheY-like chemotaxis protein
MEFAARLLLPCVAPLRVLFIDDNADTQELYSRYLTHTRYAYTGERDATQALALAAAVTPQIIVLDVMLPGIDGWEVLGRLRTHPRTTMTPVIICSILPLDQLAVSLGAAEVLQKPVSREKLLRCLDRQAAALARGSH